MPRVIGESSIVLEPTDQHPIGDELAIVMGAFEAPTGIHALAVWRVDVDAETPAGLRVRVGALTVQPDYALLGNGPLRVVGGAKFAGARRWFVRVVDQANPGNPTSRCFADLTSTPVRGVGAPSRAGVWGVQADGSDLYDGRADRDPYGVQFGHDYVIPFAQVFFGAWGSNEGASRRWLQVYDFGPSGVPSSPLLESIGVDPGAPFRLDCEEGIALRTGLRIVASSTPLVCTPDGAATFLMNTRKRLMALGT